MELTFPIIKGEEAVHDQAKSTQSWPSPTWMNNSFYVGIVGVLKSTSWIQIIIVSAPIKKKCMLVYCTGCFIIHLASANSSISCWCTHVVSFSFTLLVRLLSPNRLFLPYDYSNLFEFMCITYSFKAYLQNNERRVIINVAVMLSNQTYSQPL